MQQPAIPSQTMRVRSNPPDAEMGLMRLGSSFKALNIWSGGGGCAAGSDTVGKPQKQLGGLQRLRRPSQLSPLRELRAPP